MRSPLDPRAASGVDVDGAWARVGAERRDRILTADFFLGGTGVNI